MQSVYVIFLVLSYEQGSSERKNQLSVCFLSRGRDVFAPVETSVERHRHCSARVFLDLVVFLETLQPLKGFLL